MKLLELHEGFELARAGSGLRCGQPLGSGKLQQPGFSPIGVIVDAPVLVGLQHLDGLWAEEFAGRLLEDVVQGVLLCHLAAFYLVVELLE